MAYTCTLYSDLSYLGRVHYPFDVAVGALIGCISAVISYWLVPKFSFIRQLLTQYERVEKQVLPFKNKSKGL